MAGQRPGRVEHLHQPLERHVLVGVRGQVGVADPGEQLAEGGVAGGVGAQHQRVDEEADQVVERVVGAAGDRGADRDVGARAEPGQQRRERGLQHHEHARAGCPGPARPARRAARRAPSKPTRSPAVAGDRRAGPVGGQRQLLGQPGQRAAPVAELAGDQAVRVVLVAEQLALPQRVVGVLHRQRRPRRRLARHSGPRRRRPGRGPAAASTSRRRRCGAQTSSSTCSSGPRANSRARSGSSAVRSNAVPGRRVQLARQLAARRWPPPPAPGRLVSPTPGSPGTGRRRPRRRPCAATRAGPPRRPAPRAARPRSSRPDSRSATGMLYVGAPAPPAGAGTTAGAARTTAAADPAAARPRHAPGRATPARGCRDGGPRREPRSPATVGASNSARTASSTPSTDRIRLTSRVASSECPPRSKKSSSTPTAGTPSTSANSSHRSLLARVARGAAARGRPRSRAPAAPAGRACRSASAAARRARTNAAGTMYSGSALAEVLAQRRQASAHGRRRPGPRRRPAACPRAGPRAPRTTALRHPGAPASTDSISPSSIRKPRTFTWSSARPRNSSSPSARPPHQVAGAVHPRPGRPERVGHEPLRGQARPAEVAAGQPRTGDVQLTRPPRPAPARSARPARTPGC